MAGGFETIKAPTKTELKKRVKQWEKQARGMDLSDIRLGYDPERVVQTEDGYSIQVWAHS